jgi:hypothetical protein
MVVHQNALAIEPITAVFLLLTSSGPFSADRGAERVCRHVHLGKTRQSPGIWKESCLLSSDLSPSIATAAGTDAR